MSKRLTVKEIAARAGVSVGTVSHVLNNPQKVRLERRQRVEAVIQSLGYQPSQLARGLRRQTTDLLGVILPDITNPFFPMVVRGAEDVAFREGFRLILCNADNDPAKELVYFRDLRMFQPAGMIVIPSLESLLEPELQDPALPVVFVDRSPAWWRRDTVVADNEAGGFAVGQHMVAKGHRRLAAIGAIGLSSVGDRIEGFRRALCAAGIELDPESVRKARFSAQAGFEETLHLLDLEPRPTGIFVVSDRLAAGALRAIRERGLRCPEDVSLVGFDDMDFAGMALPPLTTVFQPGYQMGANACTLLLSRVRGCVDPFAQVVLPTELRIRSSVRALD